MKKIIYLFMSVICLCATLTSCHGVMPDADEEAVLIKKPWFFGHGGVEEEPANQILCGPIGVATHFARILCGVDSREATHL